MASVVCAVCRMNPDLQTLYIFTVLVPCVIGVLQGGLTYCCYKRNPKEAV